MRKIDFDLILPLLIYLATDFLFDTALKAVLKYGIVIGVVARIIFLIAKSILNKNFIKGVKKFMDWLKNLTKRQKAGIPIGIITIIVTFGSFIGGWFGELSQVIGSVFGVVSAGSFTMAGTAGVKVDNSADKAVIKTNKTIIADNSNEVSDLETENEKLNADIALLNAKINAASGIPTLENPKLDEKGKDISPVALWKAEKAEKEKQINVNNNLILGLNEMSQKLEEAV